MNEILTTRELSELLRLNEKKVYELVRDGTIPRVRIAGKWLFPKNHVMRWIDENVQREKDIMIVGSDDILLTRLLSLYSRKNTPESVAYYAPVGSAEGIRALARGKGHICCTHILDLETGEYNLPFLRRTLTNQKYIVVNLWRRRQGLIVKKGNPLGIKGVGSLVEKNARFVNRNEGAGTCLLFNYLLYECGVDQHTGPRVVQTVDTHLEVALKVFFDEADAGLGIEYVASLIGLDFIPLKDERFDLVVPKELWNTSVIKRFMGYVDPAFIRGISRNLSGYDLTDAGTVIFSS